MEKAVGRRAGSLHRHHRRVRIFVCVLIAVAISEGVEDRAPDFLGLAQRLVLALVVGRHLTRAPRAALSVILIAGLLGVGQPVRAQSTIPLYSGVAPGSEKWTLPETVVTLGEPIPLGAVITNVSQPTLTVFRPDRATHSNTAVIVAPGGAFHFVTMETEIGEWFRSRGITAFVLKYRVPADDAGPYGSEAPLWRNGEADQRGDRAGVSAGRCRRRGRAGVHVRAHAADYGVLPNRVGIIGFSAGAMLAVQLALHSPEGQSPDFVASLYTGMNDLMRPLTVPNWAPPAFFAVASDDQLGFAPVTAELYTAWLAAARPAELHAYAQGGHGFTLQRRGLTLAHPRGSVKGRQVQHLTRPTPATSAIRLGGQEFCCCVDTAPAARRTRV